MNHTHVAVFNAIDRPSLWKELLRGKRVGLVTNPSGVDRSLRLTSDILHENGCLTCLFSPEHGVRGDRQAGAKVDFYTDAQTGLPVYSLYSQGHHIPKDISDTLDAVAFDIQDVGARYYTYIYTLSYVMEDCAAAGKEVIVFDRLNPLGGTTIEGTVLERAYSSFVGRYPIASRHALTVGEFARYINAVERIGCRLTVIPVDGWQRNHLFSMTDLSWIAPSPNLPTFDSALCYIGTCLFEGTNLSEGRGTTRPFETIGAPWLRAEELAQAMRALFLPGVKIRPCYFTPTFSKYAGELCGGVQLHVTDPHTFRPFETGLRLLTAIMKTHEEFSFSPPSPTGVASIDRLLGCRDLRDADFSVDAFLAKQQDRLSHFRKAVAPYLLYD
ncbi:MAG: DUF1343 domain-containing protein [Clostridia bacterium]|nr:DUF1343 domain-containing protein [Clostridia bacterium]